MLRLQASVGRKRIFLFNKNGPKLTAMTADCENDLLTLTGFAGSSGRLSISESEVILWVDSRYEKDALDQFAESKVEVRLTTARSGLAEYLQQWVRTSERPELVYDPAKWGRWEIEALLKSLPECGLVARALRPYVWGRQRRELLFIEEEAGQSGRERRRKLRERLKPNEMHLIANPEDIAWFTGLRACDFPYSRSVQGRLLLARNGARLYTDLLPSEERRLSADLGDMTLVPEEAAWKGFVEEHFRGHGKDRIIIESHGRPGTLNAEETDFIESVCGESVGRAGHSAIEPFRLIKSRDEISRTLESCKLTGRIMGEVIDYMNSELKAGRRLTEKSLAGRTLKLAEAAGAGGACFPPMVASGPYSAHPHHLPHSDKAIQSGEMVVLDMGFYASEGSHAADMTRSVLAGQAAATPIMKSVYTQVLRAFLKQLFVRFPGGVFKARDLDRIARNRLSQAQGDFSFSHGSGHGLGINAHELGVSISPSSRMTLKAGYCYALEPGLYAAETLGANVFGVRLEDTVVLTQDGSRLRHNSLCPYAFDERLINHGQLDPEDSEYLCRYMEGCRRHAGVQSWQA
ncbi:MAG: aminopeptidase P family protein [Planctomycetes bacterium]|nr:aminopeptidase P family protein [Planctomycetota bacterium]